MPVFTKYSPASHGERSTHNPNPATPNQGQFLKKLVAERDTSDQIVKTALDHARAGWVEGTLTASHASALIDLLKAQPYKSQAQSPAPVLNEGIYFKHGIYYKVLASHGAPGNQPFVKQWSEGAWAYIGSSILATLQATDRVGVGMEKYAAEFGKITGTCVFCSRRLTDERSVEAGYGPKCAANNGLAWGADS